jgi:hypothetical protein
MIDNAQRAIFVCGSNGLQYTAATAQRRNTPEATPLAIQFFCEEVIFMTSHAQAQM